MRIALRLKPRQDTAFRRHRYFEVSPEELPSSAEEGGCAIKQMLRSYLIPRRRGGAGQDSIARPTPPRPSATPPRLRRGVSYSYFGQLCLARRGGRDIKTKVCRHTRVREAFIGGIGKAALRHRCRVRARRLPQMHALDRCHDGLASWPAPRARASACAINPAILFMPSGSATPKPS